MVVADFTEELDTVVIGSGPGGYVAAIRAAQEGQDVTVIEREFIGGVCLNVGCIPSKALINAGHKYHDAVDSKDLGITTGDVEIDFTKTQKWKDNRVVKRLTKGVEGLLKKNGVNIIMGEAYINGPNKLSVSTEDGKQSYSFNNLIVATGSSPIEIPGFSFKSDRVLDSTGALNLEEIPEKLVVVGGGYIGCELAGAYANFGTEVTILEGADTILGGFDKDMVKIVERDFKKNKGVDVVTKAKAKSAEETDSGVKVTYEAKDEEKTIEADYVLVTVGRTPNTDELGLEAAGVELDDRNLVKVDKQGRTSVDSIWAIGDIVAGAALAHKASYEAKVAAEAISGKKVEVDYKAMPAVAFTDPEVAIAGYSEQEAKDAGLDVKATKFPIGGNGRALSLNATDGFIRLITTKEDNVIVGGQVASVGASDIIAEIALAIESGMNLEDITLTVHAHPTLPEAVMDTAEAALDQAIHI
ncbi:Dihydrolipoyl dehydrogenase [Alloiococcus otitis]|uniref:Dihydrolipoyl dehydrogenase n=1 Tax=Alloiococcus otitis ATCC 51267 TaxID=883081 RepID=K9ET44_9LACT|nr:dihydrolipoyl dehydrogenase [Alloiococcus otitis]EKU94157.1 dihydrolipoyl dehydrogenase [Alloiococcus otitis ATCC 51267]SUU81210.1 Dihydrolipoyl dehydrogenase [Alloiococcus otitis]